MLAPGTLLGPYEIVAPIEAGGMGSVYRARDGRLARDVAIKVLPVGSMDDERLVRRFMLEARAAAALAHPNIVAIYDVGEALVPVSSRFGREAAEVRYLVEELIEGSSLRRILRSGRPALGKVVEIAIGITHGLEAAHEKGLIHRDLKPENILVDRHGVPKIADFGLVRWIYPETAAPSGALEASPTDTLTRTGFVVGTVGYMSPEQAQGADVGPASDIFAFGILLYELLTGEAPFARANVPDAFQAVLKQSPPPLLSVVPSAPPELARIVERCLEKDPLQRYQSAADVEDDLVGLRRRLRMDRADTDPRALEVLRVVGSSRSRPDRTPLFVLAAATAVVLAFAGGWAVGPGRRVPATDAWERSAVWEPETVLEALVRQDPEEVVISPDGRLAACTVSKNGEGDVLIVALAGRREPRRVSTDTFGGRAPAFTGDGKHLLFSAARLGPASGIWDYDVIRGGEARKLLDVGEDPAVSPDDRSVAYVRRSDEGSELWLAGRDGSGPRRLLQGAKKDWRSPAFAADGLGIVLVDARPGLDTLSGSASLVLIGIADPRPVTFSERRIDPWSRPAVVRSGEVLVRGSGDQTAFLVAASGGASRRLPFGASLTILSATSDGRMVLTRGAGGPLVAWRRP